MHLLQVSGSYNMQQRSKQFIKFKGDKTSGFNQTMNGLQHNYKFRLYPSALQEQQLIETLDGCRWVYNYFLDNGFESEYDMNYALTELEEQTPFLRNYHSKMLQMIAKKIVTANKALKALRKNGHKVGRLKYLHSEDYNSFTTTSQVLISHLLTVSYGCQR
jgi:transposase